MYVCMYICTYNNYNHTHYIYVYVLWFGSFSHKYTGYEFIDPTLLMTVRYGFYGEECEEKSVSELDADLNKDSSEGHTDEDSVQSRYDDQEPILHESQNSNLRLEDPHLCEEVLNMI